ncbi:MAG: hypothetical protein ACJA01_002582 [Saprospiraceae bacterium]|jgi:hypothetical protein
MFVYLSPVHATKLFGIDGKAGFVAMSFYTLGDRHPYRLREALKRDIKNFFSTIGQLPESSWINKLKKVQIDLGLKYDDLYDFYDPITPYSNIAHEHNITLVFKEGKIIKAYRGDGNNTERIDKESKLPNKAKSSLDSIPTYPYIVGGYLNISEAPKDIVVISYSEPLHKVLI